jgi:hypothetical protein
VVEFSEGRRWFIYQSSAFRKLRGWRAPGALS